MWLYLNFTHNYLPRARKAVHPQLSPHKEFLFLEALRNWRRATVAGIESTEGMMQGEAEGS